MGYQLSRAICAALAASSAALAPPRTVRVPRTRRLVAGAGDDDAGAPSDGWRERLAAMEADEAGSPAAAAAVGAIAGAIAASSSISVPCSRAAAEAFRWRTCTCTCRKVGR